MKYIALFVLTLLLISCDSSSPKSKKALDSSTIYLQVVEAGNTSIALDSPLEGVIVQIDYDGENKTTDVNGNVTFTVLEGQQHDIHVFSPSGYGWHSIYNIKTAQPRKIELVNISNVSQSEKSYVSFSGNMVSYVPENSYDFYFYDKSGKYSRALSTTFNLPVFDYQTSFSFKLPANTPISGELVVLEYKWDAINKEKILIDSILIPSNDFVTSAVNNTYIPQDFDLLQNKLLPTDIVTLDSVKIPNGYIFSDLRLRMYSNAGRADAKRPSGRLYTSSNADEFLVLPKTYQAFEPYSYPSVLYTVSAIKKTASATVSWSYTNITGRKSTITIDPKMTVLPNFVGNQKGQDFNWTAVDQTLQSLYLVIREINPTTQQSGWTIELDPKAAGIRLPQVPAEVTRYLTLGQNHIIELNGYKGAGNASESFYLYSTSWVR